MTLAVYRGLRRHGFSLTRYVLRRIWHKVCRCIAFVRKRPVTASGPA
jgi:hypothetical protein